MKPPEAPLKVCPDFGGFEAPKIALSLSGFRVFEALGPEIFGISRASKAKFGTADNCL